MEHPIKDIPNKGHNSEKTNLRMDKLWCPKRRLPYRATYVVHF